ncbi:transcriptional regulator, DeoR family [Pelagirhabdus alkalitolerans]|uniref:Transcriptional regulator, DeoR family n=1 Tax=Pelagirhabdus alkalitolerans TaxID=1612202 RepID=A0A1G6K9W6_9BACI|nr:DeoR/GlpR family DNA-binding transcription regulator [Pelagirhabdus alkalitolerans]SDC27631.1 transcriptional regulator, DeoR family [Pelagirhabdus alkalitolerans]
MLTAKRHDIIIQQLKKKHLVTVNELIELTDASPATIRRDLTDLEEKGLLNRVHGGASLPQPIQHEYSYSEKEHKQTEAKKRIAELASSIVQHQHCIYLDAGSTTYEMIPYLKDKNVTVVTNGLNIVTRLNQYAIEAYLIGGKVKSKTQALIGANAIKTLDSFYFDAVFIGTNAIDLINGYQTPDPEEAAIKNKALKKSKKAYIVADQSKLKQNSFAKIASLNEATLIIDEIDQSDLTQLKENTNVLVVES